MRSVANRSAKWAANALLLAIVATLTVAVDTAAADDTTPEPTSILIVGDSITQGRPGDFTWRYFAWQALAQAGTPVDFVGPRRGVHVGSSWDYRGADAYADANFDQDHGAWWGQALTGETRESLTGLMQAYDPDVVVSNFGINDLYSRTPEELAAAYRAWILEARSINPDVDLVIGKVPHSWAHGGRPVPFNALLSGLAGELTTAESRVEVFEVQDFTPADTWDGIHLLPSGERKYARAVTSALGRLGLASAAIADPTPAATPAPTTPPAPPVVRLLPPRNVKAVQRGPWVRVTWSAAYGAASYRVRCGRSAKSVVGTQTSLRAESTKCRVRSIGIGGVSAWSKVRVR